MADALGVMPSTWRFETPAGTGFASILRRLPTLASGARSRRARLDTRSVLATVAYSALGSGQGSVGAARITGALLQRAVSAGTEASRGARCRRTICPE